MEPTYRWPTLLLLAVVGGTTVEATQSHAWRPTILNLGDRCYLPEGRQGVCSSLQSCDEARESVERGETPRFCSRQPLVVCCPDNKAPGARATRMCKKYAEAVFVWEILPLVTLEDKFGRLDTCAIINESELAPTRDAGANELPHVALVGFRDDWWCVGSLISERYVLTSATCPGLISNGTRWVVTVRLGDLNVDNDNERDNKHEEYRIDERILHPNFTFNSDDFDVALLKLNRDVPFTRSIRPACLDARPVVDEKHAIGAMWSLPKGDAYTTLSKVNLKLENADVCKKQYVNRTELMPDGFQDDKLICAGVFADEKPSCLTEPGSPLQTKLETPYCMYSIAGLLSFGTVCKEEAGYTRLFPHLAWIESVVWPGEE